MSRRYVQPVAFNRESRFARDERFDRRHGLLHGTVSAAGTSGLCPTPTIGNGKGFGNMGIGALTGPGQFNFDASLSKLVRIGEKQTVQFRSEFFNIFNHPQFGNPGLGANASTFGQITSTSVSPRVIQLALKYQF